VGTRRAALGRGLAALGRGVAALGRGVAAPSRRFGALGRRLVALIVAVLALAALPASGAAALIVGIGDQRPGMFTDPRFEALGVHSARLSIAWNALSSPRLARELGTWMRAARADRVAPLVSFEHSQVRGQRKALPSVAQFARQFARLHARYPWVSDFATWNEANYCGEPTCHRPALVAAYYRQMQRICPRCRVLAAELLDEPNMVAWAHSFEHALHRPAGIWGLHDYLGANRLQTSSTRALLAATRGQIWLTEVGGLVERRHRGHGFVESPAHAAQVLRFVFRHLVPLSPRITRVYVYEWSAGRARNALWDSGLIGPNNHPRPALGVLVQELSALGQLPRTAAARRLLASLPSR